MPYRAALTGLWLAGPLLFTALALSRGVEIAEVRVWLLLGGMALPAWLIWREGVDVCRDSLIVRQLVQREYTFVRLGAYAYDPAPERRLLRVWDRAGGVVLECRAGHLTRFPELLSALEARLAPAEPASSILRASSSVRRTDHQRL